MQPRGRRRSSGVTIRDMARAAVGILMEDIRNRRAGEPGVAQHRLMELTLMERESSGPGPNANRGG